MNTIPLQQLVKLGLSHHEINVYVSLLKKGSLTAKKIAIEIDVLPNAVYRLLQKLIEKGLVSRHGISPSVYSAVTPSIALDLLTKQKTKELDDAKDYAVTALKHDSPVSETTINLIKSKTDFFNTYKEMAKQAKKEIFVVSIGEPVDDEIKLVNRDAVARGIDFRLIVHKYDDQNRDLLNSYIKMGWKVRHYPDWGFHLFVIDGKKSVLAVNNPKNTDERVAFQIFSGGLSKALRDYFNSVWEKSSEIL